MLITLPLYLEKVRFLDPERCPKWVYQEVFTCLGYEPVNIKDPQIRERLATQLFPYLVISEFTPRTLSRIGRFFNPEVKWTVRDLYTLLTRPRPSNFEHIGQPTPKTLMIPSPCELYNQVQRLGMITHYKTPLAEAQQYVYMHNWLTRTGTSGTLATLCLNQYLAGQLQELRLHLNDTVLRAQVEWEALRINRQLVPHSSKDSFVHNYLEYRRREQRAMERRRDLPVNHAKLPSTDQQALVVMARIYHRDLELSDSPLLDYQEFVQARPLRDAWLLAKQSTGHILDSLDLRENYNPALPLGLYAREVAQNWRTKMALAPTDVLDTAMAIHCLTNRFYYGKPFIYENRITPIYQEVVADAEFSECLSYGPIAEQNVLLQDELLDLFNSGTEVRNPFTRNPFEVAEVESLTRLPLRPELLTSVRTWLTLRSIASAAVRNIVFIYQRQTRHRATIVEFLELLHNLAMFMRGWSGSGELPIEYAPIHNQSEIDVRVSQAISQLERWVDSHTVQPENQTSTLGELLYNLPMFDKQETQVLGDYEGASIKARIQIVKRGPAVVNSCIRMASNKLAASCHYYWTKLGLSPKFNLRRLALIA